MSCQGESDESCLGEASMKDVLMFDQFDITHVLKHGEALLGSSGQEYDVFDEELMGILNIQINSFLLSVDR